MRNPDTRDLNTLALWASLFLVGYGLGKIVYWGLVSLILKKGPW